MDFPELLFEDETACLHTFHQVKAFFNVHERQLQRVCSIAAGMRKCYRVLDTFSHDFTEEICGRCSNPCCVNRHGFPDFEDLVTFQAMGLVVPAYNFHVIDTALCQFLSRHGCTLPRCSRSYRCTWYFCDYVLDEFQHLHRHSFALFESELDSLAEKRMDLLKRFACIWNDDGL